MAKLYFKYGTMNSGKSLEIIKVAHNYEEQGKAVLVLTSALDTRVEDAAVASRVGTSRPAIKIAKSDNIFELTKARLEEGNIYCILIDEAQFLSKEHIYQLGDVVDYLDIPVIAFGLKNDFQNNLFDGSYHLLAIADKIEEIKTICWYCDKKASMNLRISGGDEQIQIGGNESYLPVCRKCYKNAKQIKLRDLEF